MSACLSSSASILCRHCYASKELQRLTESPTKDEIPMNFVLQIIRRSETTGNNREQIAFDLNSVRSTKDLSLVALTFIIKVNPASMKLFRSLWNSNSRGSMRGGERHDASICLRFGVL